MKKSISCLVLLFFIISCGSGGLKERKLLTQHYKKHNFKEAHKVLDNSEIYKEKKNKLLLLMEKGMLYHAEKNYLSSIDYFVKAKDLSRKLYTVRISKKIVAMLANDNYDIYYGEAYERSMIHLYQVLNYYLLASRGSTLEQVKGKDNKKKLSARNLSKKEVTRYFSRARSEVLDWSVTIETFKNERMGKSVFKNDLMAKLLGGFMHERTGRRNDLNTAYLLYKEARDILIKNYSAYKNFNTKYKKFKKNFDKFPAIGMSKVQKDYIDQTVYSADLNQYLDYKILSMAKRIRPGEYKRLLKLYKPKATVLKRIKNEKRSNVTLLFHNSVIPPKVPDKYYFGLDPNKFTSTGGKIFAAVGQVAMAHFMINVLHMNKPGLHTMGSAYATVQMAAVASKYSSFNFELPKIANTALEDNFYLVAKDKTGKEILKRKMVVINPMGDIAEEAVAEKSAWRYTRTGSRLALKYAGAIATSYAAYSAAGGKKGAFSGLAAMASFLMATKAIKASEKADTRYWSLLPEDFRMEDIYLPAGEFDLSIVGVNKRYKLGKVIIKNPKVKRLVNFRN